MPQPLLSDGAQEYVSPGSELEDRVSQLESRIDDLESRLELTKRDAVVIVLNLLTRSLKHVASGEMDIEEVRSTTTPSKWEIIKKRLQPRLAEAIDVLLVQGSLRRTQLAAAMKMDYSNCAKNVIVVLLRQGLLIERSGLISLKEL